MAPRVRRGFLGLGTNQGQRQRLLEEACARLDASDGIVVERLSALFETEPVGPPHQDWFLNAVAEIGLTRSVEELLTHCKRIEAEMGRLPSERWGPRLIDIDILLVEGQKRTTPALTIPHPQLEKRGFVLVPLVTLHPDMVLPGGKTVVGTLAALDDPHQVIPYVRERPVG